MTTSELKRFWSKVRITALGCWAWTGGKRNGYGSFWRNGQHEGAHRFAYEHLVGPIPKGLHLDHLCRNHGCVNPVHLEVVTCRVNVLRGIGPTAVNARKTRCPQGHKYTEKNTAVLNQVGGGRRCRICHRAYNRERSRTQKEELRT